MSNSVDTRVVEMQFDNKAFESGVRETMHTLKQFQSTLNSVGAESVNNTLASIESHLMNLEQRFTAIGEVVNKFKRNVIGWIVDFGKTLSGIKGINEGMGKYESLMDSVRTMMNATGKSVEEIEAVMSSINTYTDETSYNFSDLVSSMSSMVSSGAIKDLNTAEKAVEGIANAAAHAGIGIRNASGVIHTITKAMSEGKMSRIRWDSLQMQNFITPQFIEQAIEAGKALGKLDKNGKILSGKGKGKIVNRQSIIDTLQYGWMDAKVMSQVFGVYANSAEGLGKAAFNAAKEARTFKDVLDALKDAISTGWMTSFKLLFGNVEQASKFFTWMADKLITVTTAISDFRNELLTGWNEAGGRNSLIEAVVYLWETVESVGKQIKDAFKNIFGVLSSEDLINATNAIRDAAFNMYMWLGGDADKSVDKIAPRFVLIRQIFEGVASALQFLGDIIWEALKAFGQLIGVNFENFDDLLLRLAEAGRNMKAFFADIKKNGYVVTFFKSLVEAIRPLAPLLASLWAGKKFFGGKSIFSKIVRGMLLISSIIKLLRQIPQVAEGFNKLWSKVEAFFGPIGEAIHNLLTSKSVEEFKENFEKLKEVAFGQISSWWENLKTEAFKRLKDLWASIVDWFTNKLPEIISNVKKSIVEWAKGVWKSISEFFVGGGTSEQTGLFSSVKTWIVNSWNQIIVAWDWLKGKVSTWWTTAGPWLSEKWEALKEFLSVKFDESETKEIQWKGLINRLMAMAPVLIALYLVYGTVKKMSEIKAGKLIAIALTLTAISVSIYLLSDSFGNLLGGFEGFNEIIHRILDFLERNKFLITIGLVVVGISTAATAIGLGIRKIGVGLRKIGVGFKRIGTFKDITFKDLTLGNFSKNVSNTMSVIGLNIVGIALAIAVFAQTIKYAIDMFDAIEVEEKWKEFWYAVATVVGAITVILVASAISKKIKKSKGSESFLKDLFSFIVGISVFLAELMVIGTILNFVGMDVITGILLKFAHIMFAVSLIIGISEFAASIPLMIRKSKISIIGDISKNFIKFAIGVVIIVNTYQMIMDSLKKLGEVKTFGDVLDRLFLITTPIIILASLVGMLVVAFNKMPKYTKTEKIKGFIPLILALAMLMHMINKFLLSFKLFGIVDVGLSLLAVLGMLGTLALSISSIGKNTKETHATSVIFMFIGLITVLGMFIEKTKDLKVERMAIIYGVISALFLSMKSLVKAMKKTSSATGKSGPSVGGLAVLLAGVAVILAEMGAILYLTKDVPWGNMVGLGAMITFLSISMVLLGKAAELYNSVDWASIGKLAVSLIVFAGVAFVAIAITKMAGEVKASWEDLAKLGVVMLGVVVLLIAVAGALALVGMIGKAIPLQGIAYFIAGIAIIAIGLSVIVLVVSLIMSFAGGALESAFASFSSAIFQLGSGLSTFQSLTADLNRDRMAEVTGIITDLLGCCDKIILKDYYKRTYDFSVVIYLLGVALSSFERTTSNVNRKKIQSRLAIIDDIKNTIEGINGMTGINDIKSLTAVITDLGGAIRLYYNNLSGINLHPVDAEGNEISGDEIDTQGIANMFHRISENFGEIQTDIEGAGIFASNGEGTALGNFAVGITNLTTAIENFSKMTTNIKTEEIQKGFDALDHFNKIQDHLPEIDPETGKTLGKGATFKGILGEWTKPTFKQSLGDFSLNIEALATAIESFGTKVGGAMQVVDEKTGKTNIEKGLDALDSFAALRERFPEEKWQATFGLNGIVANFGTMTLGEFASNISTLGDGVAQFADKIKDANFTKVDASMSPLEKLADLYIKLNGSNISSDFWGNLLKANNFTNFATNLGQLGSGIASYATCISGKSFSNAEDSVAPLMALADLYLKLGSNPNDFWGNLFGVSSLDNFSDNLGKLGTGVNSFVTNAFANNVTYDAGKIRTVVNMLKNLAAAQISKENYAIWDLTNQLVENTNMAADIKAFVSEINTIEDSDLEKAVDKVIEIGKIFDQGLSTGMDTNDGDYTVEGSIETTIGVISNAVRAACSSPNGEIYLAGKQIDQGLANGINDFIALPEIAMGKVVRGVINKAENVALIRSPSKVMAEIGMWLDKGLGHGISEYASIPVDSAGVMAKSIEEIVRDVTQIHSESPIYRGIGNWLMGSINTGLTEGWKTLWGNLQEMFGNLTDGFNDAVSTIADIFKGNTSIGDGIMQLFGLNGDQMAAINAAINGTGSLTEAVASVTGIDTGIINNLVGMFTGQSTLGDLLTSAVGDLSSVFSLDSFVEGMSETDLGDFLNWGKDVEIPTVGSSTSKVDNLGDDKDNTTVSGSGSGRGGSSESSNLGKQTTTVSSGGLNISMTDGYTIGDILNRIDRLETAITNMRIVMDSGVLAGQVASGVDKELGNYATLNGRWN